MNITIFLGQSFVTNEEKADFLVNKLLLGKIQSLRKILKENDNMDLPIVYIKDSLQSKDIISEKEIAIDFDGLLKWKQQFDSEDFNTIVEVIVNNIRNLFVIA
jgi:hypothetical protein